MIKTLTLLGAALVLLGGTGLGAAAQNGQAKPVLVGQAAVPIYPGAPGAGCAYYPQVITQPGGYNLTGNITLPAGCGADAIDVKADNVVIDLSGYTITGTGAGTGIGINGATHSNVTVKNGSIVKMGGGGVSLGEYATVVDLTASSNAISKNVTPNVYGILLLSGSVRQVHANLNSQAGIAVIDGPSEVSDSEVNDNNGSGIVLVSGGTVVHNAVIGNGEDGINIFAGAASTISGNTIRNNGGVGVSGSGQISNNTIVSNEAGVAVGTEEPTSIEANTIGYNTSFGIISPLSPPLTLFSYGNNQLVGNNETTPTHPGNQVQGGVQMGPNICDGVPCP